MKKQNIGLIGLGPMGQNLTLNMEDKGYSVAVYNRTSAKTEDFANGVAKGKNILPTYSLEEFVNSLEVPRKIILLVKQGKPVDEYIEKLVPLLEKDDLIIDGGNSYFKDTIRHNKKLSELGLLFIGTGISGGEEGALKGPAIMPGGQKEAYNLMEDIFKKIAAKAYDGVPCVSYIGPDGAGHFVKMVHNGIEYGDMQLIGECVWIFKNALNMSSGEIAQIMTEWNSENDVLRSYLIEITGESMKEKDKKSNEYLVDLTADITRMKGTGTWTVQSALELLVPIPTIAAAVFSREMSQDKDLRLKLSKELSIFRERYIGEKEQFIEIAHNALYLAKISSYAQGMALLQAASKEYNWNLNLGEIVKGWRSGCIIRAQFLDEVTKAYKENPELPNLLTAPRFAEVVKQDLRKLANFIEIAHWVKVPVPAMDNAFDYILQLASPVMISAQVSALQRDYFGAHGYFKLKGIDNPEIMTTKEGKVREFHTEWMLPGRPEEEWTK
ncbi:MAG TPA: phosphogluconate dehydrogenase (NADP(+)-dependent, decarboxylating) [Candidatus Atribacteria bacterium]|nr:phosphogluconate dehydrogenase (NADP(+)-dependent, decarboxylating) [Candidatus Atribacteria bacterium]